MLYFSAKNKSSFNIIELIPVFYRRRKVILSITAVALIASTIASFIIPEKYQSSVILFPAPSISVSKSLMSKNPSSQADILRFGEEEDIERMLQILKSDKIREAICNKYNLLEHYQISEDSRYKKTLLQEEYSNNIKFKKTEYMSVKIEVLDTDAKTASNIANDIASYYDSTLNHMKQARATEAHTIIGKEYALLQKDIMQKQDSLHQLMQLGVNDYESQAERLTEALGKAIIEGKKEAASALEAKLKMLSAYGINYISLRDDLYKMRERSVLLKEQLDEAKVDAHENIPEKFILDTAFPAEKKSYPIRWLIVTTATLSSLIVTLLTLSIIEATHNQQKNIRNSIISEKY